MSRPPWLMPANPWNCGDLGRTAAERTNEDCADLRRAHVAIFGSVLIWEGHALAAIFSFPRY